MGEFLNAIRGFVREQAQTHLEEQQPPNTNPTLRVRATSEVVEQFRRYNPPRFNGRGGPEVAEEWLEELDNLFTHIDCSDKQKVSCAIFQFTEDASRWWKSFYRTLSEDDIPLLTWKTFQKVVMDKYCSSTFLEKKETEFYGLAQGKSTIEEYERKFHRLSRYAPHLVDTEERMISRFKKGLRTDIKGILASHVIRDFGELVKRAEEVELALGVEAPPKPTSNPSKWTKDDRDEDEGKFQNKKGRFGSGDSSGTSEVKPLCPRCEKRHNGECLFGMGACFYCHEKGHTYYSCPKRGDKGSGVPEKKGNARFFALMQEDAAKDNDTMTGM